MTRPGTPAERRDDRATDRDDAAEHRDVDSRHRHNAADRRDTRALVRDDRSAGWAEDLRERLERIRRHLLAGLRRIEEVDIDPAAWPDLPPAALARLCAHVTEQGRLAALDATAVSGLLDDLGDELQRVVEDRIASARDRESSADDRHASDRDRDAAGADREAAAEDRDQAAIEREQSDPTARKVEVPTAGLHAFVDESVAGRVTRAVQDSRRRITDSRKYLGGTPGRADRAPAAPDPASHIG
jgi:hypothetical protein